MNEDQHDIVLQALQRYLEATRAAEKARRASEAVMAAQIQALNVLKGIEATL